jgi:aldose 1-epimerase
LEIEYGLSDEGLSVRTTATNIGASTCPFGAGAHPYLRAGTATVDAALLHVPARTVLRANERAIPVGDLAVDGTEYDFLEARPIGTTRLDHCFTDVERDGEGIASVALQDPDGTRVALWVDESYPYLMVFTGDPLPDVSRRAIAIEPMTCPPNAFRTGKDLTRLEAGQSVSHVWGIHHPR